MNDVDFKKTLADFSSFTQGKKYQTIYADPPWQFQNRTGKMAPEHKRLHRYATMSLDEIKRLPVQDITDEKAHLYLWVPNALLPSCRHGDSLIRPISSGRKFVVTDSRTVAASAFTFVMSQKSFSSASKGKTIEPWRPPAHKSTSFAQKSANTRASRMSSFP